MKIKTILLLLFAIVTVAVNAQNIGINNTGATPDPSAALDIVSTTAGFAMPRMTTSQRLALVAPIDGLLVYDTNLGGYYRFSTINNKWDCATTPAGIIDYFGNITAPIGYLTCDGSAVSRTTYPELFNAIGTLYGAGNGTTTFNLPDLRGEFIRGIDNGRGVDLGRVLGSGQGDDFKNHYHSIDPPNTLTDVQGNHAHNYTYLVPETPSDGVYGVGSPNETHRATYNGITDVQGAHQHNLDILPFNSANTGNGETRPRNIALLPCIKY